MNPINQALGAWIGRYLTTPIKGGSVGFPAPLSLLRSTLQPGDVLLVEGNLRISQMIKYLTQSTWSHAALYVGEELGTNTQGEPLLFIEADLLEGVRACPMREYSAYHTRICRPHQLDSKDRTRLINYMKSQLGRQYDLKHVVDLARYLLPLPVPSRFRRRMITLGSGDPTKAICSSLIAEGFHHIRYPIHPIKTLELANPHALRSWRPHIEVSRQSARHFQSNENIVLRSHHTLVVPRDYDVSPYFNIIKPTIEAGFDYRDIIWAKIESD